jgi:hypothetical protein
MNTKKNKAIGYICDICLPDTDIVISKADQLARLKKYAEKEGIELVGVFEDDCAAPDFMARVGVNQMLNAPLDYEMVLVERVWVFSRKIKKLEDLLETIENRGAKLIATSYLWDCPSQVVRHRYARKETPDQEPAVSPIEPIHWIQYKHTYRLRDHVHV